MARKTTTDQRIRRGAAAWRAGALALAVALTAGAGIRPTLAADAPQQASIPFANQHGIYSWKVVNDKTVLIQSQDRQWYKATLMTACFDLPFAETIGFETNADGSFDKFGAIKVRHQDCPLVSLVKTEPPTKPAKK